MKKTRNFGFFLLFLLLAVIGIIPLFFTFFMSFQGIHLKTPWLDRFFTGSENYAALLSDQQFRRAVAHTICFVFVSLGLEILLGFTLAYLIFRAGMMRKYLVQIGLFLPLATPAVLSGQMWRLFFHEHGGFANALAINLHISSQGFPWLSDPAWAWAAIVIAEIWKMIPFVTLIFLVGLMKIPKEVWEASAIDGARGWSSICYIAAPLLRTSFAVVLIFRILDGIRIFDLVYVLTQGGPGGSTDVLGLFIYRLLFGQLDLGKGSAGSVLLLLIAAGILLVMGTVFKKLKAQDE